MDRPETHSVETPIDVSFRVELGYWWMVSFSPVAETDTALGWLEQYGKQFHVFGVRKHKLRPKAKGPSNVMTVLLKSTVRLEQLCAHLSSSRGDLACTTRVLCSEQTAIFDFNLDADYLDNVYAFAPSADIAEWLRVNAPPSRRPQPSWDTATRTKWKTTHSRHWVPREEFFQTYLPDHRPRVAPASNPTPATLDERRRLMDIVEFEHSWFVSFVNNLPIHSTPLQMWRLEMVMRSHVTPIGAARAIEFGVNLWPNDGPYVAICRQIAHAARQSACQDPAFRPQFKESMTESFGYTPTKKWMFLVEIGLAEPRWCKHPDEAE